MMKTLYPMALKNVCQGYKHLYYILTIFFPFERFLNPENDKDLAWKCKQKKERFIILFTLFLTESYYNNKNTCTYRTVGHSE